MLDAIYIAVFLGWRSVRTEGSDTATLQNTQTEVMIGLAGIPQLEENEAKSAKARKV